MSDRKKKCTHVQYHTSVPSINGKNTQSSSSNSGNTEHCEQYYQHPNSPKGNDALVKADPTTKSYSHSEKHTSIQSNHHTNAAYNSKHLVNTANFQQQQDEYSTSTRSDALDTNNVSLTQFGSYYKDDSPERTNTRMDTEDNSKHWNHNKRFHQEDTYYNSNIVSTKKSNRDDQDDSPKHSNNLINTTHDWNHDVYGRSISKFDDDKQTTKEIPGVCGLSNLGNTCYMNSALQCLSNIPKLRDFFLNADLTKGQLAQSYARLMKDMWSGRYSSVEPTKVKECISDYSSIFRGYDQADAREFVNVFLNSLHDELKNEDDKSIVNDLFTIIIESRLECQNCFHGEYSVEPIKFLALRPNVQNGWRTTLDDLLTLFRKRKTLNGNLECNSCHQRAEHFMKSAIGYPLPSIIIVHFTRFNRTSVKDENPIEFPMKYKFGDLDESNQSSYELIGIVSHVGSIYSGHYTAYAKNSSNQRWYYFNDSSVHQIDDRVNEPIIARNAYMLVYAKENEY